MKLHVADIPENAAELPTWLEGQLAGPHLNELVAELTAVHRPTAGMALDEILGEYKPEVLERGLSVLKPARIARLLTNPRLLLDLQELVLIEGGAYWSDVKPLDSMLLDDQFDRGRARLDEYLEGQFAPVAPITLTMRPPAPKERTRLPWVWAVLATAACVGLGVYLSKPPAPEWGWNSPGVLTAQATGQEYLQRLADAAAEWQVQPRETKTQLTQRLDELKVGCDRLIAAKHPLPQADSDWLLGKCKEWAVKIDDLRAALVKGENPDDVRKRADDTVQKFADALRAKAKEAT